MSASEPEPQSPAAGTSAPPEPVHVPGLTLDELRSWLVANGQQRYRAEQITDWIYAKGAASFDEMTNLSKPLREWLTAHAAVYRSKITAESVAADGTRKLLLRWPDGESIETVWIPEATRHTVCVSSQVGCPVGCRFCASGMAGVKRNLTAGEIVEQALRVRQLVISADGGERSDLPNREAPGGFACLRETRSWDDGTAEKFLAKTQRREAGEPGPVSPRLSNIVFMGMGEPLANYDAVLQAIRILNAPWGLNIGARKITLSTVGLPKQIRRLAEEGLQLNLALSLHAPEQKLREELIPWGKVPLEELLAACTYYFEKTGREITLEYVLLEGVNMASEHAARLAKIVKRLRANVNLLRYNPVAGLPYERPSSEAAFEFQERLRDYGVNAHIRTSRGADIDAACGQLRRRVEQV